jgi:hypothetical protein
LAIYVGQLVMEWQILLLSLLIIDGKIEALFELAIHCAKMESGV